MAAKASAAEHSEYMFRLMLAVNDLLAVRQIQELITSLEIPLRDGISAYTIRIFQAHLVEACYAFIENVMPVGEKQEPQHTVYDFIKTNSQCLALFKGLERKTKTPDFNRLRKLRHTFVFHYNYQDHGADTQAALARLLEKAQKCPTGNENLIIRGNELDSRFVVADELVNAGWRMIVEIPESFLVKLGALFLQFAEAAILAWISKHQLQDRTT